MKKFTKYSDYFTLKDFLPVYDITAEEKDHWKSFIPTKQFEELLSKSLTALTSSDVSKRRSMWIRGTFGTGKSHASAVIKHLLCDEGNDIKDYLDVINNAAIREQLRAFRKQKHFFPVVLKGVEGAYDIPRFSLSLQRETKKALAKAGYTDIVVSSDYETAISWIEKHKKIVEEVLEGNDSLKMMASTPKKLIDKLTINDTDTYLALADALSEHDIYLSKSETISDWLVQIEKEVEERGIADGIVIFWDEFTSVMDTIKSDRINVLQNIAEKSQQNNLFLYLISHRAEAQSADNKSKDISKMGDRFDTIEYKMDDISTYLIMRHTFGFKEGVSDVDISVLKYNSTYKFGGLLDFLCPSGNEEEKERISNLFPIHPYTAYLCSLLSNLIGSANRSVIRFMNDETSGFRAFLEDKTVFNTNQLVTAEWLWDFFESEFENDQQCRIFTSIFRQECVHLKKVSEDYSRVFKAILLLNALQTKFPDDLTPERITPNEKNLGYLFSGDRVSDKLPSILDYIDTNKIVQKREAFGDFKISATSYDATELAKEKSDVKLRFKTAINILEYDHTQIEKLLELFEVGVSLVRKASVQFYSCEDTESLIRSKLKKFVDEKPNVLHIGMFLSITEEGRDLMESKVRDLSMECNNSILILPYEVYSTTSQKTFVEYIANHNLAKRYHNEKQASECDVSAKQCIIKWIQQIINGSYVLYFNGERYSDGIIKGVSKLLNRKISSKIFTCGLESYKKLQTNPMTFFKNKNYPAVVLQILQGRNREAISTFSGESVPLRMIFEDNDTMLLREDGELSELALGGSSWLVKICKQMDKCIENAHKKYQDRFTLSEILTSFMDAPYGFFSSKANYAAFSYAIRKHKADLFLPSTSQPVSDEALKDMIVYLFKMWDDGKSENSNKLLLRFGSPEEGKLTKQIVDCFGLKKVVNSDEIKSLSNAKWGVQEYCKKESKYPLWTLLYCEKIKDNKKYSEAINGIIKLFEQESPKLERIKELSNLLEVLRLDLPPILKGKSNYEKGFLNFVHNIEVKDNIHIESDWWNEMIDEISSLQEEVAFRNESDVENAIMRFYNKKTRIVEQKREVTREQGDDIIVPSENHVKKAKERVKSTNMPNMMWQQVMLELIDAHPEVAQFLAQFLS